MNEQLFEYPGSNLDIAPSLIWLSVTYVNVDRAAERFFADADGVSELLLEHGVDPDLHTTGLDRSPP